MKTEFFHSTVGQFVVVGVALILGALALYWQNRRSVAPLPPSKAGTAATLPRTFTRDGTRFPKLSSPSPAPATANPAVVPPVPAPEKPRTFPLTLFVAKNESVSVPTKLTAPYGRLIPCQTVVALESNRLETPVIGLVAEDLWHNGRLVVPAGAEVHGRASLDRSRERLAVQGEWRIVWRTPDPDNGTELRVTGLALDREFDSVTGSWGEHDGSAGLRGEIVKTSDDRELRLFATAFLSSATGALQEVRPAAGLLGETTMPVATARNAALAGTGAVLREYAEQLRDAIARDGLYLRVPAGKPFYLYVTQPIERENALSATESLK